MRRRKSALVKVTVKETLTPEQRETAREHLKQVGMPIRCQGCKTDYRTNVPACPKCGRSRSND